LTFNNSAYNCLLMSSVVHQWFDSLLNSLLKTEKKLLRMSWIRITEGSKVKKNL